MPDSDNPIISCTVLELAFVAWQVKRNDFHSEGISVTQAGPSWDEFSVWWEAHYREPVSSIRERCWLAWCAAKTISEPNHGSLHHFASWFATIVASQPVIA